MFQAVPVLEFELQQSRNGSRGFSRQLNWLEIASDVTLATAPQKCRTDYNDLTHVGVAGTYEETSSQFNYPISELSGTPFANFNRCAAPLYGLVHPKAERRELVVLRTQ